MVLKEITFAVCIIIGRIITPRGNMCILVLATKVTAYRNNIYRPINVIFFRTYVLLFWPMAKI